MRAAIEWSYDLLNAEEQRLFVRLGVFKGWTLDAAEQVYDAELDVLSSLLDKNLIRRDGERFSILDVRGDYSAAIAWGEEALAHYRLIGSDWGIARVLTTLAVGPMELGRPGEARPMLEEAEVLHRKLGSSAGLRRVPHLQGQQAAAVGDLDRGRPVQRGQLAALARRHRARGGCPRGGRSCLPGHAANRLGVGRRPSRRLRAGRSRGRRGQARRSRARCPLLGFVDAYAERLQFTRRHRSLYEEPLAGLIGTDAYEAGRRLDVEAVVERALT